MSVSNMIEVVIRNFFWNDVEEHKRFHLMDWASVCRSVEFGGLGIRKIKFHNHALRGTWLWRFGLEQNSFWRKVVVVRFGSISVWDLGESRGFHGVGQWKSITQEEII